MIDGKWHTSQSIAPILDSPCRNAKQNEIQGDGEQRRLLVISGTGTILREE